MLRIEPETRRISLLEPVPSVEYDLRQLILRSPEVFLSGVEEDLFLAATQVVLSGLHRPCELVAFDRQGEVVVVVIGDDLAAQKLRTESSMLESNRSQSLLMRAMTYAATAASLNTEVLLKEFAADRTESLGMFLSVEPEQINRRQRLLLVSDAFEVEFLNVVNWLMQLGNVNVKCLQVRLYRDVAATTEYLTCQEVFVKPIPGQRGEKPLMLHYEHRCVFAVRRSE